MLNRLLILTAAAAALAAAQLYTAKGGMDAERLARIAPRMKAFVDKGTIAGAVTLVQHHGKLASLEAVGLQEIETNKPMRPDTIFQVMSMTKPVTGVGIMILAEEGKLALNDPVEKHLPEFRGQWMIDGAATDKTRALKRPPRPITIRDLMTHTSGMLTLPPPGMGEIGFYRNMNKTLADAVSIYSQQPLEFEPGSRWMYSNPGIAVLGRIIEVVSDTPFERFLEERIFRPLGMKDSFLFPPAEKRDRIAAVYEVEKGKLKGLGEVIYRKGARYSMPEGGLYATASDMAAFYQMMLNGGALAGKRILSRAAVGTMTASHTADVQRGGTAFGLTWAVTQGPGGTLSLLSIGTFGHGGAFGTYGWIDSRKDLVGVFMIQVMGGGEAGAVQSAFVTLANAAVTD